MAPRTTFANLPDGLQALSLFDQGFADTGYLGVIPCTAAGTNAIVLTPIPTSFAPTVTTPVNLQLLSFVATATSNGAVTVQIGGVTKNLLRMDGATQAAANDIVSGVTYLIGWNGSVFQILSPTSTIVGPVITGATISGATITTSTFNGNTWTAGTGVLTLGAGKMFTVNNTIALSGTDGASLNIGAGGTAGLTSGSLAQFSSTTSAQLAGILTDETGSGSAVFGTSPALTTPSITGQTKQISNDAVGSGLRFYRPNLTDYTEIVKASGLGVATSDALSFYSSITSSVIAAIDRNGRVQFAQGIFTSGIEGIGYTTGAGGTVTQATSKSTTVALNAASGQITMNNAALAAATIVSFTFTNTTIAATDVLVLNHNSGGTLGAYTLNASCGGGGATIYVRNNTAGSLSEAIVISFALIKGATS